MFSKSASSPQPMSLRGRSTNSRTLASLVKSQLDLSLRTQARSSDPGNTANTALPLRSRGTQLIKDSISRTDPDFFSFATSGSTESVNLLFRNRSQTRMLGAVLNEQGQVLFSRNIRPGKAYELSLTDAVIPSGVYYLRLTSNSSGESKYRLKLSVNRAACGCS